MAEILIAHSNHLYSDRKQTAKIQPYPPLQTILAAALLGEAGVDVALYDPTFDASPERLHALLDEHRPRLLVVCEDDFNFISKMCLTQNRELAISMADAAAERGIPCYVHGSDSTDHADAYLDAGFQGVLIGEVEPGVLELAHGTAPERVPGLVYRRSPQNTYTQTRTQPVDLDTLPVPAWHLVDLEQYRDAWRRAHGSFSLNLVSSRGCPYRCNWCAKPVFGNNYRVRSAENVARELHYVKTEFQPDHIWFADDIFALSPRWTREFAVEISRLGAQIPFRMQSRCDLMTREMVADLRQAECSEVWMGAESGSQRVLDAMDKDIRVEDVYAARENLGLHGIRACFFLQFGYPGEKWEDIEQTIRMVRETSPDDVGISVSYPLPGTKFHQIVAEQIGKKSNWRDSTDLSMMFRGEFSGEFYRALAQALHAEVRGGADVHKAWAVVERLRTQTSQQVAVA